MIWNIYDLEYIWLGKLRGKRMAEKKEVYWHLPGFCYFRTINQLIINLMKDYPDKFYDGYRLGSVYGSFPGAIWNGGRTVFGTICKTDMKNIIDGYNKKGVPVRFTWTNSLLEEKHVYDTYCNLIMDVADNGMNQVLVNREVLENYIKDKYPGFKRISSTTKRIVSVEGLKEELEKDYFLVVFDYDMNHNEEALKELEPYADRVEILVNEICYPGCPKRTEHYMTESRLQLEFDYHESFPCPNKTRERKFSECQDRPAFISKEEIQSYIDRGYVNFKIVGRGMPMDFVIDSYLYYLVKEEAQDFVREKINFLLAQMKNAQNRMSPRR